jgi:hypothetical protein
VCGRTSEAKWGLNRRNTDDVQHLVTPLDFGDRSSQLQRATGPAVDGIAKLLFERLGKKRPQLFNLVLTEPLLEVRGCNLD